MSSLFVHQIIQKRNKSSPQKCFEDLNLLIEKESLSYDEKQILMHTINETVCNNWFFKHQSNFGVSEPLFKQIRLRCIRLRLQQSNFGDFDIHESFLFCLVGLIEFQSLSIDERPHLIKYLHQYFHGLLTRLFPLNLLNNEFYGKHVFDAMNSDSYSTMFSENPPFETNLLCILFFLMDKSYWKNLSDRVKEIIIHQSNKFPNNTIQLIQLLSISTHDFKQQFEDFFSRQISKLNNSSDTSSHIESLTRCYEIFTTSCGKGRSSITPSKEISALSCDKVVSSIATPTFTPAFQQITTTENEDVSIFPTSVNFVNSKIFNFLIIPEHNPPSNFNTDLDTFQSFDLHTRNDHYENRGLSFNSTISNPQSPLSFMNPHNIESPSSINTTLQKFQSQSSSLNGLSSPIMGHSLVSPVIGKGRYFMDNSPSSQSLLNNQLNFSSSIYSPASMSQSRSNSFIQPLTSPSNNLLSPSNNLLSPSNSHSSSINQLTSSYFIRPLTSPSNRLLSPSNSHSSSINQLTSSPINITRHHHRTSQSLEYVPDESGKIVPLSHSVQSVSKNYHNIDLTTSDRIKSHCDTACWVNNSDVILIQECANLDTLLASMDPDLHMVDQQRRIFNCFNDYQETGISSKQLSFIPEEKFVTTSSKQRKRKRDQVDEDYLFGDSNYVTNTLRSLAFCFNNRLTRRNTNNCVVKFTLIPLAISGHWYLLACHHHHQYPCCYFIDSMTGDSETMNTLKTQLTKYFVSKSWNVKPCNVNIQTDGFQCASWILLIAENIFQGRIGVDQLEQNVSLREVIQKQLPPIKTRRVKDAVLPTEDPNLHLMTFSFAIAFYREQVLENLRDLVYWFPQVYESFHKDVAQSNYILMLFINSLLSRKSKYSTPSQDYLQHKCSEHRVKSYIDIIPFENLADCEQYVKDKHDVGYLNSITKPQNRHVFTILCKDLRELPEKVTEAPSTRVAISELQRLCDERFAWVRLDLELPIALLLLTFDYPQYVDLVARTRKEIYSNYIKDKLANFKSLLDQKKVKGVSEYVQSTDDGWNVLELSYSLIRDDVRENAQRWSEGKEFESLKQEWQQCLVNLNEELSNKSSIFQKLNISLMFARMISINSNLQCRNLIANYWSDPIAVLDSSRRSIPKWRSFFESLSQQYQNLRLA